MCLLFIEVSDRSVDYEFSERKEIYEKINVYEILN